MHFLSWFQEMLPKAGALRVHVEREHCHSCGSYKGVCRVCITKKDGMTGAIYLCEECIGAIKVMI